jgi:uncharacterized protein (DUF1499 family)
LVLSNRTLYEASMTVRRTRLLKLILLVIAAVPITLYLMSIFAKRPDDLGVKQGQLKACPDSPNCVSSQAEDAEHAMEAISFEGSGETALQVLRNVINGQPRAKIVTDENGYIHAEFKSFIFRFVDDVELVIDENAGLIQFRSASRVGHSDMGANRSRMERLRSAFEAAMAEERSSGPKT